MARIKRGVHGLKHRRKVMKLVKGFRAARRRNYRVANEALLEVAGVCLSRPARPQARFSLALDQPHQRRRPAGRAFLLRLHARP